jgi:hypothetical protein
MNSILELH